MKVLDLKVVDAVDRVEWSQYPEYKKGCPKDRALIVSDGTKGCCLDHIGPALDYWQENIGDPESWDGLPAGVWIWEGSIDSGKFWTDYGWEYDTELQGEHRALTDSEWENFRQDGAGPWDRDEWVEKEAGPPPEEPDVF